MTTSQEAKIDVQGLMHREYSAAKHFWMAYLLMQLGSLLLSLYSIFCAAGIKLIISGAASIFLPIAAFFIKQSADCHYGFGERLRKLVLLHDGLGRAPSQVEILEAQADAISLLYLDSSPVEAYYSSPLPPGPQRLAHIVEESAYYTWTLALRASRICSGLVVVGFCAAFTLLWFAVQANRLPGTYATASLWLSNGEQVARVASTIFIFFLIGTFETLSKSFRSLSEAAQATFRKCDTLRRQSTLTDLDVFLAITPYDCALAKAPPIPGVVHWFLKKRLHAAWTAINRT